MHIFFVSFASELLLAVYFVVAMHSRKKKPTQRDNADNGVQFITSVGPRQSFLLAKDPDQ